MRSRASLRVGTEEIKVGSGIENAEKQFSGFPASPTSLEHNAGYFGAGIQPTHCLIPVTSGAGVGPGSVPVSLRCIFGHLPSPLRKPCFLDHARSPGAEPTVDERWNQ